MWNYYVVPEWYSGNYNVAYWDKFGRPRTAPTYFPHLSWVVRDLWWIDPEKQARLDLEHPLPQREPN
jgi:microcin C transport system substrate-binding protein